MAAPIGNQYYKLALRIGRKRDYETVDALRDEIILYFREQEHLKKPKYTVSGLASWLGFSRQGFDEQIERGKEFSDIIKEAKSIIESCYENNLYIAGCAGAIFALKNMGWKDSTETNHLNNGKGFEPPVIKFVDGE